MKRILIVDDSKTARMFIRRCLEISGFQEADFEEAENGMVAIESLKKNPADLVVSDLNMPQMDGEELLKKIKSSPRLHDIPVMIITSAANPKKIEELKSLQAFAILKKPVSPPDVTQAVASLTG